MHQNETAGERNDIPETVKIACAIIAKSYFHRPEIQADPKEKGDRFRHR
ncbi:MAG: hypothetical protein GYA34_14140 [Chloroflexi bacterium]|nr:hypothetical protein [Chloroflexota bacterium]